MEKKTKPGAIQQLLDYAGDNKKQLYFSTFLATLGGIIRYGSIHCSIVISLWVI